jgi:hypothetical protein
MWLILGGYCCAVKLFVVRGPGVIASLAVAVARRSNPVSSPLLLGVQLCRLAATVGLAYRVALWFSICKGSAKSYYRATTSVAISNCLDKPRMSGNMMTVFIYGLL